MSIAHCQERTSVSKIKVEEHGRKATFLNLERASFIKTRVDGCVIRNAIAADWMVTKDKIGDVIVELKGKDVDHAVKQVHATAEFWQTKKLFVGQIAAIVVAAQYPKVNTAVQRSQNSFANRYKGPLHVVTKNYEYQFYRVLSFKGPL
jgi:hypothetical protein